MFALAHLSDLHLSARPRPLDLLGKRGLGFINWHRGRKHVFRSEVLDAITRDLKSLDVDHTAVTGDLVNFSVTAEYVRARAWRRNARATGRCHRHPRQSRYLRTAGAALAGRILGPLHAGRRRRVARHFSVLTPARRDCADRAVVGPANRAVFSDRPARRSAAFALGRSTRPKPRPVPGRPCPSPTAEPAEPAHATSHRRRRVSSRTGGKRRANLFSMVMIIVSH